ncbi:MAG: hypothetical protein RI925_2390 [Pseudomonadota bacterium]|jgi:hypothetical protein
MKTVDCSVKRRGDAWWSRGRGQGNRMNVFIMRLTGVYPQPTSQRLSTPSLLVVFLDGIMDKEGP